MKVHRYENRKLLPVPLEQVWSFFSNPKNLHQLTPENMGFETLVGDNEELFPGQLIVHRIKLAPLIKKLWVSEVTVVRPQEYFIDQQRFGPYKFWHHLHRFNEKGDSVEVLDRVHYSLPLYPFGEVVAPAIREKVESIFNYRNEQLDKIW